MAKSLESNFSKLKISGSKDRSMPPKEQSKPDYYPLEMIVDRRTEMYVKFAKVMLIFQGPIITQRLEAIKELTSKFKHSGRLISDETYKQETCSPFSHDKVKHFYDYFRRRVKKSLQEGDNLIIIHQSMTNLFELKYYIFLAQKNQYVVLPFPPLVVSDEKDDITHTLAHTFAKFSKQPVLHPNYFKHLFFGWFLHDIDSVALRNEISLYLQDCYENILDFKDMFSRVCKSSDEFKLYYNLVDDRQDLAFSVVKIIQGFRDVQAYMSISEFKKNYGKMSKLYIVGFIFSPHMIAARVRLTFEQRKLWEMPDQLEESELPPGIVFATELLESAKIDIPNEEVTLIASKSNRTIVTGEPILEPLNVFLQRSKGRACHILLGKAKNAELKNINYDVAFAVSRETKVVQKYAEDVRPYDLDRCLARRIGKYWYIYLKETLIVNGFFSSCCTLLT